MGFQQDIRAYFGKKLNSTLNSSSKDSCPSKRTSAIRRPVIDDSDSDEAFVGEKQSTFISCIPLEMFG